MTKTTIVRLAKALNDAKPHPLDGRIKNAQAKTDAALDTWKNTVDCVARAIAELNPKFKGHLFYKACDY